MKYTRYDIKRNKRNSNHYPSIILVSVLILAVLIATAASHFIFKNKGSSKMVSIEDKNKAYSYTLFQLGSFQKKENAVNLQNSVSGNLGTTYIVEDGSINRVILGIYNEKDAQGIEKNLKDKKVVSSKITFKVNTKDLCDKEIVGLINANLQIINKLPDNNIKSIGTNDLKKWSSTLKKVDKSSKNYKAQEELLKHTLSYGDELSSGDIEGNYRFFFNILKQIK